MSSSYEFPLEDWLVTGASYRWKDDEERYRRNRQIEMSLSQWVELAIKIPINGRPEPFSFEKRRYLRTIYDSPSRRVLLKFGRQSEKSTLLGCRILGKMCMNPHYRALYVSSTQEQTKQFRRDRIIEPILLSEILQAYKHPNFDDNVFILKFVNHSQLLFRYSFLTADRIRGISVDAVYIDEIQDVLLDNIPVIEETASHGNPAYRAFYYSGTPKTMESPIEHFWNRSTQNEWAVPSDGRKYFSLSPGDAKSREARIWNVPLDEGNIGKKGLVCKETGVPIDPQHPDARWVSMNPKAREAPDPTEAFRVPQIMVPWIDWKDVLHKQSTYSRARFYNEVLALPYDSGVRPLTMRDLVEASLENIHLEKDLELLSRLVGSNKVFLGIDWGTAENTYTVLVAGAYLPEYVDNDKFVFFYFRRFTGKESEPDVLMRLIEETIDTLRPTLVGVDYGGGFDRNARLIKRYGIQRIVRYQYISAFNSANRNKLEYDAVRGRFMVERTEVMSDFFTAIKSKKVGFPNWPEWGDDFGQDFLSIYSEYNHITRTIKYDRSPNIPDDAFHASLYCLLASMVVIRRPDIIRPRKGS